MNKEARTPAGIRLLVRAQREANFSRTVVCSGKNSPPPARNRTSVGNALLFRVVLSVVPSGVAFFYESVILKLLYMNLN